MALIHQSIDDSQGYTLIRVHGELAPGEMLHFAASNDHERRTPLVVWDLTTANWAGIPTSALLRHMDSARHYSREGYKTAFVLGNEVDYGMGRIVESYTEVQGFAGEYRPFRSLEEAERWLFAEDEEFDSSDYAISFHKHANKTDP